MVFPNSMTLISLSTQLSTKAVKSYANGFSSIIILYTFEPSVRVIETAQIAEFHHKITTMCRVIVITKNRLGDIGNTDDPSAREYT